MKTIILIIIITAVSFLFSCEDSDPNSFPKSYKYAGYDSSWNKIITGYLWIDTIDSLEVKGRWDFKRLSNEENLGPQIGKGCFEGTTDMRGSMWLSLNPKMIDNNVFLQGSMRLPYRFDGMWNYIGFPGQINWGRFEATQLR